MARAIGDQTARVYAFGQRWGPEDGKPDKILGFQPGNGVHDIHMNQGSSGQLGGDNGVWQDGGLILHIAREDRRVGIFLAFQGQAWHTDDTTGDAIGHAPPPAQEQAVVRIIGALVNPVGPAPEAESVLLVNASPDAVDLSGWRIADTAKKTCGVTGGPLAPGATLQVPLTDGVALGPRRLRSHLGLSRAHQERAAGTQLDPTGHSSLEPFRPFPSRDGEGWRRRRNAEVRSGAMPYVRRLSRPVMSNEGLVSVGATDGRA